ncbi:short-chain dehydrogenase reductase 3c [Elysia marginata]|uniref:Short-chain dehydrogenase reductase 3c n=1 Tax=Elysia marginata TaxID=1093978 RepID=A0AAV4F0S0_9GAST|nr:short-chain dehydrogenase reductase 3c [Elysia marginata]
MSTFEGKSVIVTGSSSGIGLATACMFASKGSNVTVCGRDAQRLQDAVTACEDARNKAGHDNAKVISVAGDITDQAVIKDTVEKTLDAFGRLDILVANHGVLLSKTDSTLETWSTDTFDKTMECNVRSVVALIKEAAPHLEINRGNIICISSIASQIVAQRQVNYLVSKAALDHAVRCLALQLGPKGVRINAINPTFVNNTRVMRDAANKMKAIGDVMAAIYQQEAPLQGQTCGPEELVEVILFLASNAARFVHGQCIVVDGGLSLKGNPFNFPAVYKTFMQPPTQKTP